MVHNNCGTEKMRPTKNTQTTPIDTKSGSLIYIQKLNILKESQLSFVL